MADYWKSNAKKFCEICKVWFADNKVSIENHERGLKHKGMVSQKLREMGQRAKQRDADQAHLNATLISMEQAALRSMNKESDATSAAIMPTSSYMIGPQIGAAVSSSGGRAYVPPKPDPKAELRDRKRKLNDLKRTAKKSEFWNKESAEEIIEWVQAENEGNFYYWNIFSGETLWDVPTLFYTTAEYNANYDEITKKVSEINEKRKKEEEEAEEEKKRKEAEEQQKQMEAYYQLYQQYYQQQQEYSRIAAAPPPPPPPDQKSKTAEEEEDEEEEDTGPRPELTILNEPTEEEKAECTIPKSGGLLGQWVPVTKEAPRILDLEMQDKKKVIDDLPPQEEAAKPDPLFDEDEHGADIDFKEKVLPINESKKKSSKPIVFQKRKTIRSLRVKEEED